MKTPDEMGWFQEDLEVTGSRISKIGPCPLKRCFNPRVDLGKDPMGQTLLSSHPAALGHRQASERGGAVGRSSPLLESFKEEVQWRSRVSNGRLGRVNA